MGKIKSSTIISYVIFAVVLFAAYQYVHKKGIV